MSKITGARLERLRDDVRRFRGYPPYNDPSNPCVGDGYFAHSLKKKWRLSFEDILKIANLDDNGQVVKEG